MKVDMNMNPAGKEFLVSGLFIIDTTHSALS
jgi:hypothetical protein